MTFDVQSASARARATEQSLYERALAQRHRHGLSLVPMPWAVNVSGVHAVFHKDEDQVMVALWGPTAVGVNVTCHKRLLGSAGGASTLVTKAPLFAVSLVPSGLTETSSSFEVPSGTDPKSSSSGDQPKRAPDTSCSTESVSVPHGSPTIETVRFMSNGWG